MLGAAPVAVAVAAPAVLEVGEEHEDAPLGLHRDHGRAPRAGDVPDRVLRHLGADTAEKREAVDAVFLVLYPTVSCGNSGPHNTQLTSTIAFRGASAASDEKCEARAFEERALASDENASPLMQCCWLKSP